MNVAKYPNPKNSRIEHLQHLECDYKLVMTEKKKYSHLALF